MDGHSSLGHVRVTANDVKEAPVRRNGGRGLGSQPRPIMTTQTARDLSLEQMQFLRCMRKLFAESQYPVSIGDALRCIMEYYGDENWRYEFDTECDSTLLNWAKSACENKSIDPS